MHLKSLTLRGFKSFASATTLRFEPGITCVVGPNGSGKSNVVDALSWVMGEQGAKSLRGGKMEDVIFAGTTGRPPLGRAEVSLTIDNSDGALPIDYTEVTITRIMFRGGSSEYQLNGDTCRLLDIQELLSDSGIGREMHVIVGQGQLDSVLQPDPTGRRAFIEEAAGVLKHRKRKEKALRKLDAMQANLARVQDLTGELRRQLKPLGRQAQVARRAAVIQAELRDTRLRLLADDLVTLREALRAEIADEAALKERRDAVETELAVALRREARLEEQARALALRLREAQATWYALAQLGERVRGTIGLAEQRVRHATGRPVEERRGRDPEDLEREAARVREQEAELAEALEAAHRALEDTALHRAELERELAEEERRLKAAARAAADRREGLARLQGQVSAARSRASSAEAEIGRLLAARDEARERAEASQEDYEELRARVECLDADDSELDERLEAARGDQAAAEEAFSATRDAATAAEREHAALAARREALALGLRRKDGTGALLAAADRLTGVLGPAAELLTVVPGHEAAVAAALGVAADAVAVHGPSAAAQALRLLRATDAGRATLLVAAPHDPADHAAGPGGGPALPVALPVAPSGDARPGASPPTPHIPPKPQERPSEPPQPRQPPVPGTARLPAGSPAAPRTSSPVPSFPPPATARDSPAAPAQGTARPPGTRPPGAPGTPGAAPAGEGGSPPPDRAAPASPCRDGGGVGGTAGVRDPSGIRAPGAGFPEGTASGASGEAAAPRPVAELVSGPAGLLPAVRRLLRDMVAVPTLEEAESLVAVRPDLIAVTAVGDVLGGHFAHGGSAGAPSLLEVQAAVEEAAAELERLAARCEELTGRQRQAAERRAAAQRLVEELTRHRRETEKEKSAVAQQLGRLGGQARAAAGEAERATAAVARAEEALACAAEELEELSYRLHEAEQEALAGKDADEPDTGRRDRLAADGANARQTEMEARLQARTHEERVRGLAGRADALDRAARAEREARARAERRRARLAYEAGVASAVLAGARGLLEYVDVSVVRAERERSAAEQERTDREAELARARRAGRELKGELDKLTGDMHRGEVLGAEKRLRIEQLEAKALEELGVDPAALAAEYGPDQPVPPSPPAEGEVLPEDPAHPRNRPRPYVRAEQEKRLKAAEKAYAQLGRVNPLALEEFAALEERHRFLSEQLEDLKKTRADLIQVVKEVDERVEQVFTSAYHDTAREFEGVFARLFPGGEGRLVLTDPGDMLTTGVEVEARPPGKKVKRLSLLSGGERSLTAVALLVSIFKARPSPFYVMDEVEAALDDTNLQRLIRIMEELQETSQLIVITHQKRTMEVADALYGVSMQGDGVSRVVSQRLRDSRHTPPAPASDSASA